MKTINIIKGDEGYTYTAVREDGATVFGVLDEKILIEIIKIVDTSKNLDEKRMESLNLLIGVMLKSDESKKALMSLVERWQVCSFYSDGHYVVYNDKLYRSKIKHNSNYENIPVNAKDYWAEVPLTNESEYDKLWKQASYWSVDLTYKKNDLVIYYNKLYKSLKDRNISNPEKGDWLLIERP